MIRLDIRVLLGDNGEVTRVEGYVSRTFALDDFLGDFFCFGAVEEEDTLICSGTFRFPLIKSEQFGPSYNCQQLLAY